MTKRMLVDATHAEETRVVVADGNQLLEFDYETSTKKQLKGNIYLAKVTRVEPSLQAAFVDYGGNRHGFLAFNEIHPDYYRIPVEDREALIAESGKDSEGDDTDDEETSEDGAPVEVLDGDDADEIQELGDATRQKMRSLTRQYKIQEVIKRRQILLVQVVKEERGNKGAALTTYLSLPGRYCVLMPNTARGGGISRKVSNPAERKQMKAILSDLDVPDGMAVIMRTAGVGRSRAEIRRDYEYLRRLWDEIREDTLKSSAPALIYEEGDVIKRALRDTYNRDIDEVLIEGEEAYKAAKNLMKTMIPSHAKRVQRYAETDIPLYNRYQIESQLDEIYEPVVTLKSGGYLVINPTEALVAIDVNSGRATRQRNIEGTARQTNLEAAEEIARQLRLRDLAGLIVIDFIDMDENRNNIAVERRIKESMKTDRARIQIGRISPFGLLELSRQRLRPSLTEASSQICSMCGGSGHVRSTESTVLRILRAIEDEGIRRRTRELQVVAPTSVALYLLNEKRQALSEIEARSEFRVLVTADPDLVPPDFSIERIQEDEDATPQSVTVTRPAAEEEERGDRQRRGRRRRRDEDSAAASPAETAEAEATPDTPDTAEVSGEDGDGDAKASRRRRGRRGGRRRRRSDETTPETEEQSADAAANDSAESDSESLAQETAQTADDAGEGDVNADAASAETSDEAPKRSRRGRRGRRRSADTDTAAADSASTDAAETRSPDSTDEDDAGATDGVAANAAVAAEGAEVNGESVEKPKRRRRSRRKKPEPETAPDDVVTAETAPADGTPAEPAEEGAPASDIVIETSDTAASTGTDDSPVEAPAAEEAVVEEAVVEDTGNDADVRQSAAASDPGHTEDPQAESTDTDTTVEEVGDAAAATPSPQRRGWWNRVVG